MLIIRILVILFLLSPLGFAQEKQLPVDKIDEFQKLESLKNKLNQS
jgi:hypothetical protein